MADDEPRCIMPCLVSRAGGLASQTHDGAGQAVSTVAIERPLKDEGAGLVSERLDTLVFVQAAWGILLRAYTGSDDVCFRVVDENQTQTQTHATAVYRANITDSAPVRSLLETDVAMMSIGLDRLPYNTGVCYTDDNDLLDDMDIAVRIQQLPDHKHSMDLWYKASALSHEQAQMMANTVGHLLSETEKHENGVVGDINVCSDADFDLMKRWNQQFVGDFSPAEGSVHEAILRHCRESPDPVAVSAWDGDMTYGELERYSAALAAQLIGEGVKPEDFVPLCLDKSKWVAVAVLGVLRAGAAFVLLETSHPVGWLQNICKSVNAAVVLCAPDTLSLAKQLATTISVIPETEGKSSQSSLQEVACHASSALYAVFTSGSTGKPKGIVMEHGAFCASTKRTADALAMGPNTRRLQFASHAFTMCNREILMVLMLGGCLCIPSAHQRIYDLVGFMNRHRVNYANMTPSMAGMLSPEATPDLQVLLLGGEAMGPSLLGKWAGKVKVLYGYGASETSGVAVLASDIGHDWDPHNLGFARDSALWVTEVDNPHRLAPIGAVGELLIQGRGLARCYLGDEERNRRVFLNGVEWLEPGQSRLYRTGDLVRYNVDGSIHYMGRRDKQIKLNGQLVDLNHVEHELQRCMQALVLDCQSAAIVAIPAGGSSTRRSLRLVVVLGHGPQLEQDEKGVVLDQLERAFPGWTAVLEKQMTQYLPRYMIPSHFVFCNNMPMTKSGKANRPKLTELVTEFLADTVPKPKTGPWKSREEHALSDAWTQALGGQPLYGDDFFRKGGDSIAAIQLIARLREENLALTVDDIFRERTFHGIAAALRATSGVVKSAPLPFSLYTADITLLKAVSEELGVDMGLIEDLYPCTPMQEALVASSIKDAGASIAHHAWTVPEVNLNLFKEAWGAVWRSNPILRSRIVRGGSGMLQVVTRTDMSWRTISSLDELEPLSIEGGPLIQLAVKLGQPPSFHLIIHHAIFDAWSLNLVCKQVQAAYQGMQISTQTFSQFIPYLRQNSGLAAVHFWRRELERFKGRHFPEPPVAATVQKNATMTVAHSFDAELTTGLGFTPASFLRLAWANVLAQETGSPDVIFGAIVTGRNAALQGIDKLSGPTLALVPVRVQLGLADSVDTALQGIQDQSSRMTPYEQTGLQHIAKAGDGIAAASNFQNVMVIQQRQRMESMRSGLFAHPVARGDDYLLPFTSHPFLLVCQLGEDKISLQASFDPCAVSSEHARRLLHQLAHVFKQLTTTPLTSIADVSLIPTEDQNQIKQWNSHVSPSSSASIVDLIQQRVRTQPDAIAVCGAGCSLTYQDLDRYSTNVAARLILNGVKRGKYVPLMFNKSPWATVAMVAVLRAGAAFVMLPPAYPLERLRNIVSETEAQIIVASATCAEAARQLLGNTMILDNLAVEHPPAGHDCSNTPPDSVPRPEDPAYVVFTSGSTGKPKGIVLHHSAVTTGIVERCQALQMDSKSRVFQFASYAFDVSINDNVMALVAGGCICVPSEAEQQNDPSTAATRLQANWAMVTPSIIRLLDPGVASTLRTFVVGGEPLTRDIVQTWASHVRIIQIYGPAECTVLSTIQPEVTSDSDVRNIGKAVHSASWIVDPQNHDRLQPIGMTGELLLQGPTVGLGYLNDPKQTAAAFGPPPQWLPGLSAPGSSRAVYRTGDLVKYAPDGSLIFVGRKDLQVKFRGQRLEPGEVEAQIVSLMPSVKEVAVEMVQFSAPSSRESLVAFMCHEASMRWGIPESRNANLDILSPAGFFYDDIAKLSARLGERLSSYMVPTIFIPLRRMPLTLTVKVNRKLLREEIATWLPEEISAYRPRAPAQVPRRNPVVAREKCIHRLACSILNRDAQSVSMDDDFFSLGGDSITATLFALAAKREGIHISVNEIFQHHTLSQLAEGSSYKAGSKKSQCKDSGHAASLGTLEKLQRLVAKILKLKESQVTASSDFFDLGGDSITCLELAVQAKREGILITEQAVFDNPGISALASVAKDVDAKQNDRTQTRSFCTDEKLRRELPVDILPGLIDVLPTTQFQRMSNSMMNYRYYRIQLPVGFDKARLLRACEQLVHRHAILRTGFFRLSSGEEVQLVLQPGEVTVHEHHVQDLDAHCRHDDTVAESQDCGKPPFQMQLVTPADGRVFLVFRLGHALFDGLSIRLIGEDIASLYNGQQLPETNPLSVHLRATLALRTDAAFNTWRRVLEGSQVTRLTGERIPVVEDDTLHSKPAYLVKAEKQIATVSPPPGFTLSTLLKAAWATTLAETFASRTAQASSAIVFGQVVHGRGVGVPHEDRILGPCISIVPVRVNVDQAVPQIDLLRQIQQQMVETMPYTTLGFDDIRENSTTWPKGTTLPSFLRIRNYQFTPPCWLAGVPCEATHYGIPNKPSPSANVHVVPSTTGIHVDITVSSHVLGPSQVGYLVERFCRTIQLFDAGC